MTSITSKISFIVGMEIEGQDGGTGFFIKENMLLSARHIFFKGEIVEIDKITYYFQGRREQQKKIANIISENEEQDWVLFATEDICEDFQEAEMEFDLNSNLSERMEIQVYGYPQISTALRQEGDTISAYIEFPIPKNLEKNYDYRVRVNDNYTRQNYSAFSGAPCFYENRIVAVLVFQYEDEKITGVRSIKSFYSKIREYIENKVNQSDIDSNSIKLSRGQVKRISLPLKNKLLNTFDQNFVLMNFEILLFFNHLLPQTYLIQLCDHLIKLATESKFGFYDYFDVDRLPNNLNRSIICASSNFQNLPKKEVVEIIFNILDGTDEVFYGYADSNQVKKLNKILSYSSKDFSSLFKENFNNEFLDNSVFSKLMRILYSCANNKSPEVFNDIKAELNDFSPIIQLLIIKHISDLYVDINEWAIAKNGYEIFLEKAEKNDDQSQEIFIILKQFAVSSIGVCIKIIEGDGLAYEYYTSKYKNTNIYKDRFFFLNSRFDAVNASESFYDENLFSLYNLRIINSITFQVNGFSSRGEFYRQRKDYNIAHRLFWADIRRYIAVGDYTNRLSIQSKYSFCNLDSMLNTDNSDLDIYLPLEMLICSNKLKEIENADWSKYDKLFHNNFTANVVDHLFHLVNKYSGIKNERLNSLITFFKSTIKLIEKTEILQFMWNQTFELMEEYDFSSSKISNLSQSIYKLLIELIIYKKNIYDETLEDNFFLKIKKKIESSNLTWLGKYELFKLMDVYIGTKIINVGKLGPIIKLLFFEEDEKDIHVVRQKLILISNTNLNKLYSEDEKLKNAALNYILKESAKDEKLHNYAPLFLYNIDSKNFLQLKRNNQFIDMYQKLFEVNLKSDIEYSKLTTLSLILDSLSEEELNKYFTIVFLVIEQESPSYFFFLIFDSLYNTLGGYKGNLKLEKYKRVLYDKMFRFWLSIDDKQYIFSGYKGMFNPNSKADENIVFNFSYLFVELSIELKKVENINILISKLNNQLKRKFIDALFNKIAIKKEIKIDPMINPLIELIEEEKFSESQLATSSIISNLYRISKKNRLRVLSIFEKKVFLGEPKVDQISILGAFIMYRYKIDHICFKQYYYKVNLNSNIRMAILPYLQTLIEKNDIEINEKQP